MSNDDRIESFEEFWDFYVGEHSAKATRVLHFLGTTAAMGLLAGGLLTRRRWMLLLAPIAGYGPAWISHFFIEKNRPASFTYPLWSLQADFVMWWKTVTGTMDAEIERVARKRSAEANGETGTDPATATVGTAAGESTEAQAAMPSNAVN